MELFGTEDVPDSKDYGCRHSSTSGGNKPQFGMFAALGQDQWNRTVCKSSMGILL